MLCETCLHRVVCGKHKATGGVDKCRHHAKAEYSPELVKVIELLDQEYGRAKRCDFVRKPLAYALYHVWKKVDGRG